MSTVHEVEAKIAATQDHLTKRIDAMNERILEMQKRIQHDIDTEALRSVFKTSKKVDAYRWHYEYSFQPGRRCFVSNNLLPPGMRAYKGTFAVGRETKNNILPPSTIYPAEIWITKEEFTIRRLKGLL